MGAMDRKNQTSPDRLIGPIGQVNQFQKSERSWRACEAHARTAIVLELSVAERGELPPVGLTLPVGEAVHRAVIRKAARGKRIDCPELIGQNRLGHPLVGPHGHAHVLPVDADEDGCIDHVVIFAPMGLGELAVGAISSLRTLFGSHGRPWLKVRVSDQRRLNSWVERLLSGERECGSAIWASLTPFVAPRFVKRSGKNCLIGQVRAELVNRGFPEADVEILPIDARLFRGFVFDRGLDHAPPPQRCGHGVRLQFARPVCGPVVLGYACHFGLGLFQAVES